MKAYTTYVLPILENNSVIWCPYLMQDVHSIESVQRHYIKSICRRCNLNIGSYLERLNALGLNTLEYRRCKYDVILVYKIIHGLIDLNFSDFFSFSSSPYNLRRHSYSLKMSKFNTDVRKSFFSNRIIKLWNSLPDSVVNSPSIYIFRKRLDNFDLRTIYSMVY